MNINSDKPIMVFKREYQGKEYYSLGLSKKDRNNNYINGYMACEFRKGVNLENKTKIYIKSAFITFYLKDKTTVPYIKILEFDTVEQATGKQNDMWSEFGEQVAIDDNMLD